MILSNLKLSLSDSTRWPLREPLADNTIESAEISKIEISGDSSSFIGREFIKWHNRNTQLILAALRDIVSEKFLVFGTTAGKVQDSAVFRYRGIWKIPDLQPIPKSLEVYPEVLFSCEGGLRFSAMAIAGESELNWVARAIGGPMYFVAIFPNNGPIGIELSILNLTRMGFPPDGCGEGDWPDGISWQGISSFLCSKELIFLRSCSHFGDEMCKWEIVGKRDFLFSIFSPLQSFLQSFEEHGSQLH